MKLEERLSIIKKFLHVLTRGPSSRSALIKAVIRLSPSYGASVSAFNWLKTMGLIRKVGPGHFDPYEITEDGEWLLNSLQFLKGGPDE